MFSYLKIGDRYAKTEKIERFYKGEGGDWYYESKLVINF